MSANVRSSSADNRMMHVAESFLGGVQCSALSDEVFVSLRCSVGWVREMVQLSASLGRASNGEGLERGLSEVRIGSPGPSGFSFRASSPVGSALKRFISARSCDLAEV